MAQNLENKATFASVIRFGSTEIETFTATGRVPWALIISICVFSQSLVMDLTGEAYSAATDCHVGFDEPVCSEGKRREDCKGK